MCANALRRTKLSALAVSQGLAGRLMLKWRDFSLYAGADAINHNRAELAAASGLQCDTDEEVALAAEAVMRQTGAALLVTRAQKRACPISRPARRRSTLPLTRNSSSTSQARATPSRRRSLTAWSARCRPNAQCGSPIPRRESWSPSRARRLSRWTNCAWRRRCVRSLRPFAKGARVCRRSGRCFDLPHPGQVAILQGAARLVRPSHCRAQRRKVGIPAQRADAAGATSGGARRDSRRDRLRRSRGRLRRRHAFRSDRRAQAGPSDQGRRSY